MLALKREVEGNMSERAARAPGSKHGFERKLRVGEQRQVVSEVHRDVLEVPITSH